MKRNLLLIVPILAAASVTCIAGTLEGPIALLLRILWHSTATGRHAAAACFLLGALASRYAWIWAGRASAHDPQALFQLQRKS